MSQSTVYVAGNCCGVTNFVVFVVQFESQIHKNVNTLFAQVTKWDSRPKDEAVSPYELYEWFSVNTFYMNLYFFRPLLHRLLWTGRG